MAIVKCCKLQGIRVLKLKSIYDSFNGKSKVIIKTRYFQCAFVNKICQNNALHYIGVSYPMVCDPQDILRWSAKPAHT